MKYLKIKSIKINKLILKEELKRKFYKSIFLNVTLSNKVRQKAFIKLSSFSKNSSISSFKSRCLYTNNSRGVLKFFKMSRIHFRHLASYGNLSGIKKAS